MPAHDHSPKACKSCGAPIYWARKGDGRAMPVDAEPVENGNVRLFDRDGTIMAQVLGPSARREYLHQAEALRTPARLRIAHHVTCPNREDWRSKTRDQGGNDDAL